MTDNSANTVLVHSPKKFGVISLSATFVAFASWPLMVVIGFVMVYVSALFVFVAVASGLLAAGSGLYYKEYSGAVMGAVGVAISCCGVGFIISALTSF